MPYFNTEGPGDSDDHYCLDPLQRFNMQDVETLIDRKKIQTRRYFNI
jgi:hypothetical protein